MTYTLYLEIPYIPTRLNVFLRMHFHRRNKINKEIYSMVNLACTGKKPISPLDKYHLAIERHSSQTLDWDNCVASYKGVVDGLCHARVLLDDRYDMSGPWDVTQHFRPKKQGPLTIIRVLEK